MKKYVLQEYYDWFRTYPQIGYTYLPIKFFQEYFSPKSVQDK